MSCPALSVSVRISVWRRRQLSKTASPWGAAGLKRIYEYRGARESAVARAWSLLRVRSVASGFREESSDFPGRTLSKEPRSVADRAPCDPKLPEREKLRHGRSDRPPVPPRPSNGPSNGLSKKLSKTPNSVCSSQCLPAGLTSANTRLATLSCCPPQTVIATTGRYSEKHIRQLDARHQNKNGTRRHARPGTRRFRRRYLTDICNRKIALRHVRFKS